MLRDITPVQILLLLLVILLLFGAKRLPDLTRSIGKSMRIMKTEVKGLRDDDDEPGEKAQQPSTTPAAKAEPAPLEGRAVDEARREQRDEQHRTS